MAIDRKSDTAARRDEERDKEFYASRYGREMSPAEEAPYFLMGTAAAAAPGAGPLEVGFFAAYGVIVTVSALEQVVFLPFDAVPS